MHKTSSQLAFVTLCFGASAGEPNKAPSDQTAAPQTAAAGGHGASHHAAAAAVPGTTMSMPSVGAARPTQPATSAAGSGSAMTAAAGSCAAAAGAGAAAAGIGANMGPSENAPNIGDRVAGCDEDPLTALRGFAPMADHCAQALLAGSIRHCHSSQSKSANATCP